LEKGALGDWSTGALGGALGDAFGDDRSGVIGDGRSGLPGRMLETVVMDSRWGQTGNG
jgi:hypothetical protein